MRTILFLIAASLLIPAFAFSAEQTKENEELKEFSGEIQKIDLQSKTITLRLHPKTETPSETSTEGQAKNSSSSQTATNVEETKTTDTTDNLKTVTFNDKTEIAALEADETDVATETKISDLNQGDKIKVHVNDQGVIEKIEIIAAD